MLGLRNFPLELTRVGSNSELKIQLRYSQNFLADLCFVLHIELEDFASGVGCRLDAITSAKRLQRHGNCRQRSSRGRKSRMNEATLASARYRIPRYEVLTPIYSASGRLASATS